MHSHCPTCSKVNPSTATFCYYDGRALSHTSPPEAWWLETMGFPTPFSFSDGQSCGNFNQLALACDSRWNEARSFLANGIWCAFFNKIGRNDLATAAIQAAKEADRDVGLAYLLERLPTDAVRKPTLSLLSQVEDLGKLEPGKDHKFEVVISNKGSLVLSGRVVTDCDWLFFGDRQGSVSRKLFQTRDNYTLTVRVLGSKLRAGRQPLTGQIEIETNGGKLTLAVKAMVPIVPFPSGLYGAHLLTGAKSPREVAVKAKAHPQEASTLFEQGAVEAWYTSNGWAYPVQGSQGKGKAAVQQFFEALGLTRPPTLEISTQRIVCRGEAGKRLTKTVTLSTKEAKFVTAEAHSDQRWIVVQPGTSEGNRVTIPLCIDIPPRPGESLQASVTIQGNGQQQFVVPVTLTVEAGTAIPEINNTVGGHRTRLWAFAGVGVAVVLFLGVGSFALSRSRQVPVLPIVPTEGNSQPQQQQAKVEAWWDGIPNQTLAASAKELKGLVPADSQAIFDQISVKSDTDRFKVYEQLATKLPALVRNEKAREPLARFLTECSVYEQSELNIGHVRRALAGLYPKEGDVFLLKEKGEELERAVYSQKILFKAMNHKAVSLERARNLAKEFGTVFGFSIDTSARPAELEVETEKLLAMRCYRNTLPTASQSIDYALTMRAVLIEKYPKYLSQAIRDPIDADLLVLGLAKGDEEYWPKLEPIFKTCVASDNGKISLKLVGVYAKANPALAKNMEVILAPKWKVAGNAKWTQAEKVVALRKILTIDPSKLKITMADRLSRLQKWTNSTLLPADKTEQKSEIAHLQHTVRLAHASTMGSILFIKGADVERFDELIDRVPEAKAPAIPEAEKKPEDKPKAPAERERKVIDIGVQPYAVADKLTKTSERDPGRGTFRGVYSVSMRAGQLYTIDLQSTEFNSYLRLESALGRQLAVGDSRGGAPTARITYAPRASGTYRVIATTAVKGAIGSYTLQIQQGGGIGRFGPGMPLPRMRIGFSPLFGPVMPLFPVIPVQPKVEPEKEPEKGSRISESDLADLAKTQRNVRVSAFNKIAANLPKELKPAQAEKIARYLLVTIASDAELDEVSGKLDTLANGRHLLPALADIISGNDKVTQQRTEAVVSGILGQRLRFAKDEDWQSACRKLLLQRALDLTVISATAATADMAAEFLRDLYKEQGLAFGIDGEEFLARTQPTRVLEDLIKHVAAKVTKKDFPPAEKEYLEEIDRHLKAARFASDNDLENMVLLQRIWIKVLISYLHEQVPAQARAMRKTEQDLVVYDHSCRNVFDQLRVAEEKILRVWALAHNLKGS